MTNDNYIAENKTSTFKAGDKVVMHTCYEASLPKYKGKTEKTYWFDKMTGEVKESVRNDPERYSLAKDYIFDTKTGEFKKVIKTKTPAVLDGKGNIIEPEKTITTYEPATKKEAVAAKASLYQNNDT
jgi:hypothetical protein